MTVNALKERAVTRTDVLWNIHHNIQTEADVQGRTAAGQKRNRCENNWQLNLPGAIPSCTRREVHIYMMDEPVKKHTEEILEPGGTLTFR